MIRPWLLLAAALAFSAAVWFYPIWWVRWTCRQGDRMAARAMLRDRARWVVAHDRNRGFWERTGVVRRRHLMDPARPDGPVIATLKDRLRWRYA